MKTWTFISNFIIAFLVFGCSGDRSQTPANEEEAMASAESDEIISGVCLWKEVSMRETPSEKGKYLTTVYRGEKLIFLGDTAVEKVNDKVHEYNLVQLAGGAKGWMRKDFIVADAIPAAFLKSTTIYKRPDLMTATMKSFEAMDFVAITSMSGSEWCEVKGKPAGDKWFLTGWVKSENLTRNEKDVQLSILVARAMEIEDTGKREEEFLRILGMAEFRESLFYNLLEAGDTYGTEEYETDEPGVEPDTTSAAELND